MRETQQSISQWASASFGEPGTNYRVAARANEEMAELVRAVAPGGDPHKAAVECADVWIVLCRLAERQGFQLNEVEKEGRYWTDAVNIQIAAARAQIWMGHTLVALAYDDGDANHLVRHFVGRVVAFLRYICQQLGYDLDERVDHKMGINHQRKWKLDGSGHGYHVKHVEEPAEAAE